MSDSFQPPLGSREERIAHNEAWSRSLNERKAEWMSGRDPMAGFRCECWQADCSERILLSGSEWEMVRSRPNRFAVAPDHVADNIEAVIDEHSRFWLVEKYGKAGQIAEELASSD